MIACGVNVVDLGMYPHEHTWERRRRPFAQIPVESLVLAPVARSESGTQIGLVLVQHVDAEAARVPDTGPRPPAVVGAEQDQGRLKRHRGERLAGETDRSLVVHTGDHGDSACELTQCLSHVGLRHRFDRHPNTSGSVVWPMMR